MVNEGYARIACAALGATAALACSAKVSRASKARAFDAKMTKEILRRAISPETGVKHSTDEPQQSVRINTLLTHDPRVLQHYPSLRLPSYDNLLCRKSYLSSVNYRNKIPNWVAERVTIAGLDGTASRNPFIVDPEVPEKWRSAGEDFWDTGYTRGHMAASALHKESVEANSETFIYSGNILPQDASNNGCDWYRLENLSKRFGYCCEEVYVISGPMWLPTNTTYDELKSFTGEKNISKGPVRQVTYDVLGPKHIAAPTHIWKVIVAVNPQKQDVGEKPKTEAAPFAEYEGKTFDLDTVLAMPPVMLGAFVTPNSPENKFKTLDEFSVPLRCIEILAGVDLEGVVEFCEKKTKELTPSTKEEMGRAKLLELIDLCGSNGSRCADLYVKKDKRMQAARYTGQIATSNSLFELEKVWKRIERIGSHTDNYIKRVYEKKVQELQGTKTDTHGKETTVKPKADENCEHKSAAKKKAMDIGSVTGPAA